MELGVYPSTVVPGLIADMSKELKQIHITTHRVGISQHLGVAEGGTCKQNMIQTKLELIDFLVSTLENVSARRVD